MMTTHTVIGPWAPISKLLISLLLFGALGSREASQDTTQKQISGEQRQEAINRIEQAVKHVLLSQVEAWNKGDLEGYMQGYLRSPDLTFFSGGTVTQGWEPTLERYRKRYQSGGNEMGHLEFQDLQVEPLGAKSAVATGKWELTMRDGKKPHGLFTLIFRQTEQGWKIIHDHTSSAE
ncbi:MAG TPA: nuclear transport factor 2 family protein [Candidatus Angelobacter sp.]|jgi:ketosteroid isomerase-like protein|nr:nuclear transport factor 2 family protein [Candidatus Angelobacter sp.]